VFTLIVPFHADVDRLPRVLGAASEARAHGINEILFCHNGPNAVPRLELPPNARLLHTDAKGIGAGYRIGIAEARERFVVLSASDLPFGFSDVDAFVKHDGLRVGIGSKAHPQTQMPGYSLLRKTATYVFWLVRRVILGRKTPRDSQGTIIIETALAREVVERVAADDYFFSLELLTRCIRVGVAPVELPVRYEGGDSASAVNLVRDTIAMVRKTWQLR
jgi:dolichyl-phosphate beta-glucosyltransferase